MEIIKTHIDGLLIIKPRVFSDDRGYFFESFRSDLLNFTGTEITFIQDNESMSQRGVLRGLHFQNPPFAQAKLVRVVSGAVLDVAVDIRTGSKTFGQHAKIELSGNNKTMLFIPEGFAHGFLTLADNTIFQYKCSRYYNKESEGCIFWNDPDLNIDWGISSPVVSEKDMKATLFSDFNSNF